ncbi:uncharacterized protein M421DRAFT_228104 [Didymella exigua CBS 183.55]|uniref:Uncharacterized protein n=1 Tax=Didymella exigua CBS 183.55 TaxID=1150837 RepID=A0A6A5REM5_9PLEO|nr:uncharacterized protein M421DRAFT_228104 [Didymella exigua CBS 183.55]KAF1925953.1 hypothetical protein M421DRAFT_228104 [Didymella exigua CBS 183.55]
MRQCASPLERPCRLASSKRSGIDCETPTLVWLPLLRAPLRVADVEPRTGKPSTQIDRNEYEVLLMRRQAWNERFVEGIWLAVPHSASEAEARKGPLSCTFTANPPEELRSRHQCAHQSLRQRPLLQTMEFRNFEGGKIIIGKKYLAMGLLCLMRAGRWRGCCVVARCQQLW